MWTARKGGWIDLVQCDFWVCGPQYTLRRDNDENMTRAPGEKEGPQNKGGNAAERLRQFLAERFGDEAPPIPPDEDAEEGEPDASSESDDDSSDRN